MTKNKTIFLGVCSVVIIILTVCSFVYLHTRIFLQPTIIRSEVFGEVASGTLFTTLVDLHEFESNRTASTPYILELSATGTELYRKQITNIAVDYQPLANGLYSIGFFSGTTPRKNGKYQVFTTAGETVATFTVQDNPTTDAHGITLVRNGNYIIPSYRLYDNPDGSHLESFVIEEQTPTGEVTFTWNSLDHVPLDESNFTELRQYWLDEKINDYFHGNSVAEANDGNLLVSARHTNCVYKINRATGEIMWRMGGIKSDFTFINDPHNGFSHQHSIHQLPNGNILLYDNGNLQAHPVTRVAEYSIDEKNMTATLVWSYSDGRFTYATGSVQRLKNGNTLIGWGLELQGLKNDVPRITEIDSNGNVVMNIYFPSNSGLYNAFKAGQGI